MHSRDTLEECLKKHFAALSAVAASVGILQQNTEAALISRSVYIPISDTIDGVYLNVVTGLSNTSSSQVPGWDLNPYRSSTVGPAISFYTGPSAGPALSRGYASETATGAALNVPFAELVGSARAYNSGTVAGTHFPVETLGILGFRFQNEANGNAVHYGWAFIDRRSPPPGSIGVITAYEYESVAGLGIKAAWVPEPASLCLLALGASGLLARRPRQPGISR